MKIGKIEWEWRTVFFQKRVAKQTSSYLQLFVFVVVLVYLFVSVFLFVFVVAAGAKAGGCLRQRSKHPPDWNLLSCFHDLTEKTVTRLALTVLYVLPPIPQSDQNIHAKDLYLCICPSTIARKANRHQR